MSMIERINSFTELPAVQADDAGKLTVPTEIEIFEEYELKGGPNHPDFSITADDLAEYAANFKDGVRKGVPIDFEHGTDPHYGKRAGGWIKDVVIKTKQNGKKALFGAVDWNKLGTDAVADRQFRFVSGDFYPRGYKDPEAKFGTKNNVLKAVTLTNHPLMKGLSPVMASDSGGDSAGGVQVIYAKEDSMNIAELRLLDADKLTAEQKAFLETKKSELSEAELTKFGLKAEVKEVEKKEEPKPVTASDGTVSIQASELESLKAQAAMGEKAYNEAREVKASAFVEKLVTDGAIKAGEAANVLDFIKDLSDDQREAFSKKFVANMAPRSIMAGEIGAEGGGDGVTAAADELKTKTEAKMAEAKVDYASAMKSVLASDNDLAKRVNEERKASVN